MNWKSIFRIFFIPESKFRQGLIVLSILYCFSGLYAYAQEPEEALIVAENFVRSREQVLKSSPENIFDKITRHRDIWIFERHNPEAFVMVKKEKRYSVAAYSFQNTFLKDGEIPEPGLLCLDALHDIQIEEMADQKPLKSIPQYITPLLQTKWNQDCFFNYECPTDYNGFCDHVAVGCVPVAMGQIMRYYGRFNKFILEEKYESNIYPDATVVLGNYNWDKMENEPLCIDLEVSKFLYHLGVITRVNYSPKNTSTSTYNAWVAFGKMTYLASVRMVRSVTNEQTWIDAFYKNISEYMPIYVAGSGHAFVCDGYDSDGFFHFNLGWGGSADGYYPLIGTGSPFIGEALTELRPHSLVLPPTNLQIQNGEITDSLVWESHPYAPTRPYKYRIYQDEKEFGETEKFSFPVSAFEHGKHMIKVSAWYVNGESRWIGPVEIYNPGPNVNLADNNLRKAINRAIGIDNSELETHIPRADELIGIKEIIVNEPVEDLGGIEYCRDLLKLVLSDNQDKEVDLSKLTGNNKLKVLTINKARLKNIDRLGELGQLVYLNLNNLDITATDFLSGTKDLLDLRITNIPIPGTDSLVSLERLENLDLMNTGLQNADFINQLNKLKSLNLSDNLLTEFELDNKMNYLRFLYLNNNFLDEMKFIEKIPHIFNLQMDNNMVKSLELFQAYDQLQSLSFADNEITLVKANRMQPELIHVDLSGNKVTNIDRLVEFAPNMQWLDLSRNKMISLWLESFQHLRYLDLSDNNITNIEKILLNPSLIHINLSNNAIGDFYPLISYGFHDNLKYLNIEDNPCSIESFQDFVPQFEQDIDTVLFDTTYNIYTPSYPTPLRESSTSENHLLLQWEGANEGEGVKYDLYFGESGKMNLAASQLTVNNFTVDIDPDQRYEWQVIARLADTSFTSGIFNFRTFEPIQLPFFDGFEDYRVNNLVSMESPYWSTKSKDYTETDDGMVVSFRHYSGDNSLKLLGNSHILLPLDNFSGEVLYIEYALLIPSGNIACVRLTEISGIKVEVFFKVNKTADILINGKLVNSFGYSNDRWFPVRISLSGNNNKIYTQFDGITSLAKDWKFPKGHARIENIEFSGERSPNFPSDGYPLYYIDDINIREMKSVSTDPMIIQNQEIIVYPNPVDQVLTLELNPENPLSKIYILNIRGQIVMEFSLTGDTERATLNTSKLPDGLYWIYYQGRDGSGSRKIIINH